MNIMGSKKNYKKMSRTKKDKWSADKRKKILIVISLTIIAVVLGFAIAYIINLQEQDIENAVEPPKPKDLTDEETRVILEKLRKQEALSNPIQKKICEPGTKMVNDECEPIMIKTPYR